MIYLFYSHELIVILGKRFLYLQKRVLLLVQLKIVANHLQNQVILMLMDHNSLGMASGNVVGYRIYAGSSVVDSTTSTSITLSSGTYNVKAVDYFGRESSASDSINISVKSDDTDDNQDDKDSDSKEENDDVKDTDK